MSRAITCFMPPNQNSEQAARDRIDGLLADYVLFVHEQAVGVIEAKKQDVGQNLTVVEEQTAGYASAKLK